MHCRTLATLLLAHRSSSTRCSLLITRRRTAVHAMDCAGKVTLDAAAGCVHLTSHDPLTIALDMTMTVTGAPFTGTITVAGP